MLSYERELVQLNAPSELIAIERREVFSIHNEVRAVAWAGAMLIAAGIGVLVSKRLNVIGPVTLALAIGAAAALCYAVAGWRRSSNRQTLLDEYLVLLGALLISVDAAYIESQFRLLDAGWPRAFLIVAVAHAVAAYAFDSKPVLTLAIAAFASWLGVESRGLVLLDATTDIGWRALLAASLVSLWRALDVRFRTSRAFEPVFEHAAANLALFGAATIAFDPRYGWVGALLTLVVAAFVVRLGFQRRSEPFIIYAYAYSIVAIDAAVLHAIRGYDVAVFYLLISSIAAIAGLFAIHGAFRRRRP